MKGRLVCRAAWWPSLRAAERCRLRAALAARALAWRSRWRQRAICAREGWPVFSPCARRALPPPACCRGQGNAYAVFDTKIDLVGICL